MTTTSRKGLCKVAARRKARGLPNPTIGCGRSVKDCVLCGKPVCIQHASTWSNNPVCGRCWLRRRTR